MSEDKTNYHESQVADRVFANAAPDGAVDGCYIALWTTNPSNQPDEANEVSGDSYSPVQVTASNWNRVNNFNPRKYENAVEVDFGVIDTSSSKTIEGYVAYDGSDTTNDNALYCDSIVDSNGNDTTKTVDAGDEAKFNVGELSFAED